MIRTRKAAGSSSNGAVEERVSHGHHELGASADLELTDTEKLLVSGLFARLREIQRMVLDPYNADATQVNAMIEATHGLPPGAIGTTHQVNPQTMRLDVVLAPKS